MTSVPFTPGFDYAQANDLEDTLAQTARRNACRRDDGTDPGRGRRHTAGRGVCARRWLHFAQERDILLIADEVQTGCRAHGQAVRATSITGVKPDIVIHGQRAWAAGCPSAPCCCQGKGEGCLGPPGRTGRPLAATPCAMCRRDGRAETIGRRLYRRLCAQKARYMKSGPSQACQV